MSSTTAPFAPLTGPDFGRTATAAGRYKMPSLEEQQLFSEGALGQHCGLWLQDYNREAYDLFAHIPNGGLRTAAGGNSLKGQHTKAGYPDYFLAWPCASAKDARWYNGLFVELKTARGKVAPAQVAWHARLRAKGYRVEVIRSLDEFVVLLTDYLG